MCYRKVPGVLPGTKQASTLGAVGHAEYASKWSIIVIAQDVGERGWRQQNARQQDESAKFQFYVKQELFFLFLGANEKDACDSSLATG
jgi:hypothetical protein